MNKHNNFQKQIRKCLDQIPAGSIASNESLLRVIAQELAIAVDGIGKIANIDYTQEEGDGDDTGDTGKSEEEP
jgi:hypothetical protein